MAGERRAQGLWAAVRLDLPRSVTFFERAGFVEQRRTWVSRLDLSSLPTLPATPSEPPSASPEIRYTTLAEEGPDRPEVRQRYYRLHRDSGQDVPRMGPKTPFTYAQFEEIAFAGPGYLPDGVFLAQAGDEYVSVTALARLPLEPDTLHIEFTGTLRGYRGRGIASELKRRSIAFARSRGYRYLKTGNDSTNAPIWAINQKLGFRKEHVWLMGERTMEPSSPPAPSTGR